MSTFMSLEVALVSLFNRLSKPPNVPLSFLVERTVGHRRAPCTAVLHISVSPVFERSKQRRWH